jgi:transposase InsO family protein
VTKKLPEERVYNLKKSLDLFPSRSKDRKRTVQEFSELYGVSFHSVYRALRKHKGPKRLKRTDEGIPRVLPQSEMEMYCQIIAAMKLRTRNKKGHHLSTNEALRLLEEFGMETNNGFIKAPKGVLKKTTVNRYLRKWGLDFSSLDIEPPAVRFQAKYSNDCWQFDLSPSDLKELPDWSNWRAMGTGKPILMLFSLVDDRSGVAYQEYHTVYGEDVEAALRFLYHAMSAKDIDGFPFQGIPKMIYTDNGPIAKSLIFQRVLEYMGIELRTHMPSGKDGRRKTARSKGKVERPFLSVKELHETLYHFHQPKNEEEANAWLLNFLLRYNEKPHRSENHSRIEDWVKSHHPDGIQQVCSWERYATFAREPERRVVGSDAYIKADGTSYRIDPELAGKEVILLWGLFDAELYVEFGKEKYGPYLPVDGPIQLHRFRKYKKTAAEIRADAIEKLAKSISLPKTALSEDRRSIDELQRNLLEETILIPFNDPDPFQEFVYPNVVKAKNAIADYLGIPLAKLSEDEKGVINQILEESLEKKKVLDKVYSYFRQSRGKTDAK